MFSRNAKSVDKEQMMAALDIRDEGRNEKYLGLPVYMGKSKEKTFAYLKDKVWKRVQGWKEKLLSMAGKEIFVEVVAQAIPSYTMSCFDLTKKVM